MTAEQFEIDLGKKLQKLREDKGKTQSEVAEELGLNSRETVKQWESWDRHIKARDLIKLSQYYGVSSDYLLGISDVVPLDPDVNTICKYTGLSGAAVLSLHGLGEDSEKYRKMTDDYPDRVGTEYFAKAAKEMQDEQRLISRFFEDKNSFRTFFDSLLAVSHACSECSRLIEESASVPDDLKELVSLSKSMQEAERDLKVALSDYSFATTVTLNSLLNAYDIRSEIAGEIMQIETVYSEILSQVIEQNRDRWEAQHGEHKED